MLGFLIFPLLQNFAVSCADRPTFFGLVPWYQFLQVVDDGKGHCSVTNFTVLDPNHASSFLLIGLAVLDDLIRVAALMALGYVIYGGITYVTSQGSPDQTGRAQNTIVNALIGLVIAVLASGIVTFIGKSIGA